VQTRCIDLIFPSPDSVRVSLPQLGQFIPVISQPPSLFKIHLVILHTIRTNPDSRRLRFVHFVFWETQKTFLTFPGDPSSRHSLIFKARTNLTIFSVPFMVREKMSTSTHMTHYITPSNPHFPISQLRA